MNVIRNSLLKLTKMFQLIMPKTKSLVGYTVLEETASNVPTLIHIPMTSLKLLLLESAFPYHLSITTFVMIIVSLLGITEALRGGSE